MSLGRDSLLVIATVLTICFTSCSQDTTASYIPTSTVARDALQTALTQWQLGAANATIETSKPAINVFDLRWQAGQKLESFQITEELTGQPHPSFNVKIKLDQKPEETNTYLVVGIDPLLVFRDTDYQKATGQ